MNRRDNNSNSFYGVGSDDLKLMRFIHTYIHTYIYTPIHCVLFKYPCIYRDGDIKSCLEGMSWAANEVLTRPDMRNIMQQRGMHLYLQVCMYSMYVY